MESCLGIYLGDKVIRYAKLIRDTKSKRISLSSCDTRYVIGDKDTVVAEIISQVGTTSEGVCFNLCDYSRIQTEVFKQLGKGDIESVLNLEVGDYATENALNEKNLEYRYMFMNSTVSDGNNTAEIAITNKANINKYQGYKKVDKIAGIYPEEYILHRLVQTNSNFVIANIDEKSEVICIVDGKIKKIIDIDISMKRILDNIAEQEGSYSKACDLCKSINVLSDESISPDIEKIIEPTIQDILNRIKIKLDEEKIAYERIYLNGLINLFINIDVLFEQYFGKTTEKLRPQFLKLDDMSIVSQVIEANDAIALAYEGLEKLNPEVNFSSYKNNKSSFVNRLSKKKNDNNQKEKSINIKKIVGVPYISLEKVESALLFANLTAGVTLAGYLGFSTVYDMRLTNVEKKINANISKLENETIQIKSDTNYVDENTNKYTSFNNYISETVDKIREGKIGKYTTYNVANFMQKIAKYIPANVQIETISSDNNKSVSIVAKSTSYAELGYFISQLKLQGILENISTGKVENGTYITVTIGGDLP